MISVTTALLLPAPFLHESPTSHYHKILPHIPSPPPRSQRLLLFPSFPPHFPRGVRQGGREGGGGARTARLVRLRVGHHLVLVDRLVLPVRGESFRGSIEDVALRREGGKEGGREREACWSLDDSSAKRKEEK